MPRRRTDKVQLMFNAGEYSPFMDSRVDTDKAAAAARELKNTICEVTGEARRRPGLRFVEAIPGPPEFYGVTLTNFAEFPFWYSMAYQSAGGTGPTGTHGGPEFRGWVRYWENGVVEMWGKARYTLDGAYVPADPTYPFSMWIGSSETTGNDSLVVSLPTDNTWQDVDWTGIPGVGEYVWVPYGSWSSITTTAPNRAVRLFKYPGGIMPYAQFDPYLGVPGPAATAELSYPNATDLRIASSIAVPEGSFGQWTCGTWLYGGFDVSNADPTNWAGSTFEILTNLVGGLGLGDQELLQTDNRLIPDSDTEGYGLYSVYYFAGKLNLSARFGPIMREGRGITLGQGIVPE